MAAPVIGPAEKPSREAETLASFDSVPLFMKSLPEDSSQDTALAALQSLVHEGTPNGGISNQISLTKRLLTNDIEVAQNFKEQGNEYFKGKRYREAVGFYNQGVDVKPTDSSILEALLLNRAACNLELRK